MLTCNHKVAKWFKFHLSVTNIHILPMVRRLRPYTVVMESCVWLGYFDTFLKVENLAMTFVPGPSHWHEEFPVATEGKRQSPIDIQTAKAVLDEKLRAKVRKTCLIMEILCLGIFLHFFDFHHLLHLWRFSFWIWPNKIFKFKYYSIPEKALKWSYVPENNIDIENTGASFKVNVDGKGSCECHTVVIQKYISKSGGRQEGKLRETIPLYFSWPICS